jgi:FKBP-type peptidyl-prolyl cis-trans isomerase SlyD
MHIQNNKKVSLAYTLTLQDEQGEFIEEATQDEPLIFTFGNGEMLTAFEAQLADKKKGDTFKIVLTPAEAYGEKDEEYVMNMPKGDFVDEDGELDEEEIYVGNVIELQDEQGNMYQGEILEIKEESIILDFNHPLAGEVLCFNGVVVDVA